MARCEQRAPIATRTEIRCKFLYRDGAPYYVKGVTYGPFRPDETGSEYGTPDGVRSDFAAMAAEGINSVRCYTVPPVWLLDIAAENGLTVLAGLPWEQHVAFLAEPNRANDIERRVREGVRACARHAAVLGYTIGNEIPAPMVRWHGRRAVEAFLERLYRAVKEEDPTALVTYVNYPSTEYLDLSFCDFFSFNVYLEERNQLEGYLARLQTLAGDKPLLMAEVGLDSIRNGEALQAETLEWQIESVFGGGAGGLYLFSWTDEWHRGGQDIKDWAFGLTTVDRRPKPSLAAVSDAFQHVPFIGVHEWPSVSVVVCTYNGGATIRECLEGLSKLDYPNYEVIVVNDGSSDNTAQICSEFDVRLINIENKGLSNARNVGMQAAKGDIVAYIDDDAIPEPAWLKYIAHALRSDEFAGVGGPNLPVPGDGDIADCVANAPGGPTHVLLTDREAEHIPGCNMAFRRECLEALGGFDVQFCIAGDDVDLCWRIDAQGWRIGFVPAAIVWHHRRGSISRYLRQQRNYGRAEAMLEVKWPEKYNAIGHIPWQGRIYGHGVQPSILPSRTHVYFGTWGLAPFQRLYEPSMDILTALAQMPEWYILIVGLGLLSLFGLLWTPLLIAAPFFILALLTPVLHGVLGGVTARYIEPRRSRLSELWKRSLTSLLHFLQPLVRLIGRFEMGLTPWRRCGNAPFKWPKTHEVALWFESWDAAECRLAQLQESLRTSGTFARAGGAFDSFDLVIRAGLLGAAYLKTAIEEHGMGKQLMRVRVKPVLRHRSWRAGIFFGLLALLAAYDGALAASLLLGAIAAAIATRAIYESGTAVSAALAILEEHESAK